MPQLGETVAEGKITKWFKAAGDAVKPGDNLFEIETDKTSMEVPSTTTGTLSEIRFKVGDVAKVGAVVAIILGPGDQVAAQSPAATPAAAKAPTAPPRSAPVVTEAVVQGAPIPRSGPMDPFREVQTPKRNLGPADLPAALRSHPWRGGSPASRASICHASQARVRTVALSRAMWGEPRRVRQFRRSEVASAPRR